jgi:outer membrane protein assembly factor BamE
MVVVCEGGREEGSRYNASSLLSAKFMNPPVRCALWLAALLATAFLLSACETASRMVDRTSATVTPLIAPYVTPYKIDVVQGNVVTREQLAALKIGMPRAQVPGVVGTSLLVSVFHANRWDYVFSFKRKGGDMESRRVTLWFEADKLARIEADELPSEAEFVASLKGVQAPGPLPTLQASPEQLQRFPAPAAPAASAAANAAPAIPGNYPPLESPSN